MRIGHEKGAFGKDRVCASRATNSSIQPEVTTKDPVFLVVGNPAMAIL
jgi:hypothetical protein